MEQYIQKTIVSVLKGEDYRPYVLATINGRFLDNVRSLTSQIFEFKLNDDDWIDNLLSDMYKREGKRSQFELLWFSPSYRSAWLFRIPSGPLSKMERKMMWTNTFSTQ